MIPRPASSVPAPHTYAEWAAVLDLLQSKTDDEAALAAMRQGTIQWQSGVAERFVRRFADVLDARLNAATDRFQREIGRSRGEERVIVPALLALRRELQFLLRAADLPALPENERKQFVSLIRQQADSIQKSLEDSARNDRTGKLASIIRGNRVNNL